MEAPYIVMLGSSNEAGFLALLDDVPIEDMTRWVGAGGIHPPIPARSDQRPYDIRVPGIRLLTPRRPYSTNVARSIAGFAGGRGTIDYSGAFVDGVFADSWLYVRKQQSAQGKLRRVLATPSRASCGSWLFYRGALLGGEGGGAAHRVLIDESACPATSASSWLFYRDSLLGGGTGRDRSLAEVARPDEFGSWGEVRFLLDSYTIAEVDITRTVIRRTASGAPPFTSAVKDRDVLFLANNGVARVVDWSHDTITVDVKVPANLSGGFVILTGANACETLPDLANPAKCVLQDLTFFLDENAPVFLDGGTDVCNYDATPFQCPRIAFAGGPTIDSVPELGFHVRSELEKPLVVVQLGISASMISPFLQGAAPGTDPFRGFLGWFHEITSLDFHPTSPNALFTALTNAITCARLLIEAEGNTPKCAGIFINLFDNDPVDQQRVNRLGANTQQLLDALWEHVGDDTVPVALSGPSRYGGIAEQRVVIYDQLYALKAANRSVGVFDARMATESPTGVFVYPDDYAFDGLHFSALGQIKKARGYYSTWKEVLDLLAAPPPPLAAPAPPTPMQIVAMIDSSIASGECILSYTTGTGRMVTLQGLDKLLEARRYYVAEDARQKGLRRTRARFTR